MYIHHKWPNSALKSPYTAYQSQIGLPPSTLTRKNRGTLVSHFGAFLEGINDIYWGDIAWGIIPKASKSHQSSLEVSEAMGGTSKSAIYSLDWFSGFFFTGNHGFYMVFTIQYRGVRWKNPWNQSNDLPIGSSWIFPDINHPAIRDPWNSPHQRAWGGGPRGQMTPRATANFWWLPSGNLT